MEYRSLASTTIGFLWLESLLTELRFPLTIPSTLWCDNIFATYLAANPIFHSRSKHLKIDFHFVQYLVAKKILHVHLISTREQLADVLTKALPIPLFLECRSKLRVHRFKALERMLGYDYF